MDKEMENHSVTEPLQHNNDKIATTIVGCAVNQTPLSIDIQFSDIHYSVPHRKEKWKKILCGVTGELRSSRLTAILGPSGAGKSTFLSLLASRGSKNRYNLFHGSLRFNGTNYIDQPELFRKLQICYIPQEFALMPLLTTRETIYVAARLKLPNKSYDATARQFVINDVVERLGLQECMDTLTSNLSGGEKKRLSIAVEMITSPSVMLLDEPTSGLDSTSSNQVINLLCSMAQTGCTVICAVHQPSSQITCSFDDLLIMSNGTSRYCGPRDRVLDYFREAGYVCPPFYNLAEFVLEVVTGQRGGNYLQMCSKDSVDDANVDTKYSICSTHSSNNESTATTKRYAVSRWEQHKVLLHRAFICNIRDNTLTNLRLSAHIIVAILLGLVFYKFGEDASKTQSNIACVFFFAVFLFFANSMPSVQMFPVEATVFLRENKNNWYSLESYYITKVLSDLPLQVICPTCFLIIAYYMTGQPIDATRFFQVWLICTLFTVLAQSFGIVTGAAFDTHAGMFLVPAFNIPMFLFAGFFLKLSEIPTYLQFFSVISYFRYAFEGIIQAIYLDRPKMPCSTEFCYLRHSKRILEEMNMPSVPFSMTVFALFAWIVVLHLLIYGVLRWKLVVNKR